MLGWVATKAKALPGSGRTSTPSNVEDSKIHCTGMAGKDTVMPEYTLFAYGTPTIFKAEGTRQLARRLYRRTTWTWEACLDAASRLRRGVVCVSLDFETVILAGRWDFVEDRPEERPEELWSEPPGGPPDGGRAAAGGSAGGGTPLLSGGVK